MMSSGNRADKNKQTNMGISSSKPETAEQPSESANLLLDTEQDNQQLQKNVDELRKTLESTKQKTMANVQSLNALLEHHQNSEADFKEKYRIAYQSLSKYKEGYRTLDENLKLAKADVDRLSGEREYLLKKNDDMNTENNTIKKELSECKSRLSKLLSDRLTDNNPQIADLSDPNRPTKLAEKHSELYDNQWTDAFEELQLKFDETQSVQILLHCLMNVHRFCTEKASEQVRQLKQVAYMQQTEEEQRPDTSELKSMIKEIRKHTTELNIRNVCKAFAFKYPKYSETPKIWKYVEECVKLCWLMNAQDPPVVFGETPKLNADFNIELYKPYTQKGVTMQYLVWPVLLLNEGGALLAKGIGQGFKSVKNPELGTRAGTESEPNQGAPNVSTNHDDSATNSSGSAGNEKTGFQDARVKMDASAVHTNPQAVKEASNTGIVHSFNNIPSSIQQNVSTIESFNSGSAVPTNRQPENTCQTQTSTLSQNTVRPTDDSNSSGSRQVAASHPDNGATTKQQNLSAPTHGGTVRHESGAPPEMGLYYKYKHLGTIECAIKLGKDVFLKCDAYFNSAFGSK